MSIGYGFYLSEKSQGQRGWLFRLLNAVIVAGSGGFKVREEGAVTAIGILAEEDVAQKETQVMPTCACHRKHHCGLQEHILLNHVRSTHWRIAD